MTDVVAPGPTAALELWGHSLRLPPQTTTAVSLASIAFGGTTSYIVNAAAATKILRLASDAETVEKPWDIQLRDWCREEKLRVFTALPFLTRAVTAPSQIQQKSLLLDWWSAFRDLLFCDRDLNALSSRMDELDKPDDASLLFGRVMAAMTDPSLISRNTFQPRATSRTARVNRADSRSSVANNRSSDDDT